MSNTLFQTLFSLIALPLGIYAGLGIWFPSLRMNWRGTNITAGSVSCAGFALAFISGGLLSPFLESIPIWATCPMILGLILALVGFVIDIVTQGDKSE